jgi:hypothetical protein
VHLGSYIPSELLRGVGEGEIELIHELAHSEQRGLGDVEADAETFAHIAARKINPYSGFSHGSGADWAANAGHSSADWASWLSRDMFRYGRRRPEGGGGGSGRSGGSSGGGGGGGKKPKKASLKVPGFSGGKVRHQTDPVDTRFRGMRSLWNPFSNRYEKMTDNRLRAIIRKWFRLHPRQAFKSGPDQRLLWNPFKRRKEWMGPHYFRDLLRKWQKKHPHQPFPSEGDQGGRRDEGVSLGGSDMSRIEAGMAMAELTPGRTDDDITWLQRKIALERRQLKQAKRDRNWGRVAELASAIASDRAALVDLKGGDVQANLAEQVAELTAATKEQTKVYLATGMVSRNEGLRLVADMVSGEIVGKGVAPRAKTAGSGQIARY